MHLSGKTNVIVHTITLPSIQMTASMISTFQMIKSVSSSSLMTASDGKENVNVIIRPDDNIIVIIQRGHNLKCYDPACDNTNQKEECYHLTRKKTPNSKKPASQTIPSMLSYCQMVTPNTKA